MTTTYSLSQLVETANQVLASEGLPSELNERLVRHYASSKALPSPAKQGREAVYDEAHLNALLSLRRSQSRGITSKGYTQLVAESDSTFDASSAAGVAYGGSVVPNASLLRAAASSPREGALAYLRGISPTASAPESMTFGIASASQDATALVGMSNQLLSKPVLTSSAPAAESWTTWEVAPGVRFEVRSDVGWTKAAEDSLLAIISTLHKPKQQ